MPRGSIGRRRSFSVSRWSRSNRHATYTTRYRRSVHSRVLRLAGRRHSRQRIYIDYSTVYATRIIRPAPDWPGVLRGSSSRCDSLLHRLCHSSSFWPSLLPDVLCYQYRLHDLADRRWRGLSPDVAHGGPPLRLNLQGLGDCGPNQCGAWDLLFPPVTASAACTAYVACLATGGGITPTPAQVPGGILSGDPLTPNSPGGSVQDLQKQCTDLKGTWDPIGGTCTPSGSLSNFQIGMIAAGGVGLLLLFGMMRR